MYKALYRSWRPLVFDDVIGQDHIVTTLKNEVKNNRISHSYLFTGSRGTGKTSCSRIFAKAINCKDPVDGNPCGKCSSCIGIENDIITDIVEIDAASNNGVEDIKELKEGVRFHPSEVKYRVYIIDEVHMLSKGAFNALLKIMEEPPQYVVFILATTESNKVPATILSRCQRFDFLRVKPDRITQRIMYIADKENFSLSEEAAMAIANISDGGMRDAISILDQCSSLTNSIEYDTVNQVAGLVDKKHISDLVDYIIERDSNKILQKIDYLYDCSIDLRHFTNTLLSYFRNLMIVKSAKSLDNLVFCSENELKKLKDQSKHIELASIFFAIEMFQEIYKRVSSDFHGKALLEMSFLKLISPENYTDLNALSIRLSNLERAVSSGKSLSKISKIKNTNSNVDENSHSVPDSEVAPDIINQPVKKKEVIIVDGKLDLWNNVLNLLQKKNPPLAATLENSQAYIKGDFVLIDAPNAVFLDLMRASEATKESLRKSIESVTGKIFKLGPVKRGSDIQEKEKTSPLEILRETAEKNGILAE